MWHYLRLWLCVADVAGKAVNKDRLLPSDPPACLLRKDVPPVPDASTSDMTWDNQRLHRAAPPGPA